MDVPRGTTGTGVDAGTRTTLAIVGLSIELPLLLIQSPTLPTFESRCTKASSALTGHDVANLNHRCIGSVLTCYLDLVAMLQLRFVLHFHVPRD